MFTETFVKDSRRTSAVKKLSESWVKMLDEIESGEFRDAITALTSVDLSNSLLEVRASTYESGCFIDPHTDRPEKKLLWFVI
uniref:Putative hydroxylase NikM-like protein n=1 Tax=Prochloron didemni P3-Solomon TaxID=910458 RepID=G0XS88_PRODI|nr:putative hydroxylase NikM-like protein [Prochloron didemni P3-Solomon]